MTSLQFFTGTNFADFYLAISSRLRRDQFNLVARKKKIIIWILRLVIFIIHLFFIVVERLY